jgi:photosystem II stability/assembly factor-like uncharacterized protein
MFETNAIAASRDDSGLLFSSDSGATWRQSDIRRGAFNSICMFKDQAIAASSNNLGLFFSTDFGATWSESNINSGGFNSICMFEIYAIAASSSNSGLFFSRDFGETWRESNINSGSFNSVSIVGTNAIAASASNSGLFFSRDFGETWRQSVNSSGSFNSDSLFVPNELIGSFNSVSMVETNALASSDSDQGIYYTNDSGETWTQSNQNTGNYSSVSMFGTNGIVVSGNLGLYYNTTPLCYEKNTEILCLVNNEEKYIKISELKIDMVVKTYKNGYKKIKYINKMNYKCMNHNNDLECLYKYKDGLLIITGGHSILVDKLTPTEEKNNKKHYNFKYSIEDKQLLLACSSDNFEKLINNLEYELYHLVLENEDVYGHYGIYVSDGFLSESCSEKVFKKVY